MLDDKKYIKNVLWLFKYRFNWCSCWADAWVVQMNFKWLAKWHLTTWQRDKIEHFLFQKRCDSQQNDNDKWLSFIQYNLCLHHYSRFHGVQPPIRHGAEILIDNESFVFRNSICHLNFVQLDFKRKTTPISQHKRLEKCLENCRLVELLFQVVLFYKINQNDLYNLKTND